MVKRRGISCLANELSACEGEVRFVDSGCRPECNNCVMSRPNNLTGVVYKIRRQTVKRRGISCLANELSACEGGVRFVDSGCRPECNNCVMSRPNNLTGVVYKILQRRERLL